LKLRIEREEPRDALPRMERASPKRHVTRREKAEPSVQKLHTLTDPEILFSSTFLFLCDGLDFGVMLRERPDPMRRKLRRDRDDPIVDASQTDMLNPQRAN
jgi:hypothetical protein